MAHTIGGMLIAAILLLGGIVGGGRAVAAAGGTISGQVTDSSGVPITSGDICLTAQNATEDFYSVQSTSTGGYTISNVTPGSYTVEAEDCYDSDRNDVPTYYGGGSGTSVIVSAGETTSSIDIKMQAGTSISGHVYAGAGTATAVGSICVSATPSNGSFQNEGSAESADDGSYSINHLEPGLAYQVEFSDCESVGDYAPEYYNGATTSAGATLVTPTAGGGSAGIDAHLAPGSTIEGTVSDASGSLITSQDVCVSAESLSGDFFFDSAVTTSSGRYTVNELPAGSYDVYFADCDDSTRDDVPVYYNNALDYESASPVVLSTGGTATNVDAQLPAGADISGTVYAGSGTAAELDGICVEADATSPLSGGDYYPSGYASTASDGTYTISHLPAVADGYQVRFEDCSSSPTYVTQYFGGDYSSGQAVDTTAASPATGIDAHLQVGGVITGMVHDSAGNPITSSDICVDAELQNGDDFGYSEYGTSMADGSYRIGALPSGSFDLSFSDCYDSVRNDVPAQLSAIGVVEGQTTSGQNTSLLPGTSISGFVYGGFGTATPLAGVCVDADDTNGSNGDDSYATSGPDGSYTVEHLQPGDAYNVFYDPNCGMGIGSYGPQYYDGVSDPDQAQLLTPTLATPLTGIDANLASGAPVTTITGGPANAQATNQPDAAFAFTSDNADATFQCSVDSAPYQSCSSPFDTGVLTAGLHTFTVRASAGGQVEGAPPTVSWTVDPSAPTSTSQGSVTAGGTFSSDPGANVSSTNPVIVGVTPPADSQVTLTTAPAASSSLNGYTVFGQQVDIATETPGGSEVVASASDPIQVQFSLDASQIPAGVDPDAITVLRDGVPAADCTTSGQASPDPCVSSRTFSNGELDLVVLTTHCSTWNFATAAGSITTTTTTTPTPITTTPGLPVVAPVHRSSRTSSSSLSRRIRAALRRILAPSSVTAHAARFVRRPSSVRLRFVAPSAGRLTLVWQTKRQSHGRPTRVAVAGARITHPGVKRVTLKFTRAGSRLLMRHRRLRLEAVARFAPRSGSRIRVSKAFTLKR